MKMDSIEQVLGDEQVPKKLFETIFNLSPHFLQAETNSGRILMVNRAVTEALDVEPEEVEHMSSSVLWQNSSLLEGRRNAIQEALQNNQEVVLGKEQFSDAQGVERFLQTKVIPVNWPGYDERVVIIFSQDITTRSQLHQQLDEANAMLDRRVQERTSELMESQDKLVRQERLAVLGRIAGNIAHEIRNPLSAIHQSLFLLQMELDDAGFTSEMPIIGEQLDIIEMELNHSNEVITRMLESTRVKSKIMSRVDIGEAIQQAENQVWIGKEAKLEIRINPQPFYVWGDPVNFRQVFANLLDNSKVALAEIEHPEVTICCDYDADKSLAIMEISDNGCGIPEDIKEMVWETLFTTSETGTGLGLCICREIIEEKYGGEMSFTSEVGKGTTFRMELPVDQRAYEPSSQF